MCRNLGKEVVEVRNKKAFLAQLKVCSSTGNLKRGKEIHAQALDSGGSSCVYIATSLVNMYARCGCMVEAHQVFDSIKHPDVAAWNALILGYAENWDGLTALELFSSMKSQSCAPTSVTFLAALKACTSLALKKDGSGKAECIQRGKQIHLEIGYPCNSLKVQNTLIDMYSKCGSMPDARQVFEDMKYPNLVSWNALILGYAENGEGVTALDLFARMRYQGCAPNSITFVSALKACASLALEKDESGKADSLQRGKQLHLEISCNSNTYVLNTLIDMYAKCGSMADARHVFDSMKYPDVVAWNALILGYAENGEPLAALELFARMKSQCCTPNSITFVAALKACSSLALQDGGGRTESLEHGKQIHGEISCHLDIYVQSTLIDMYAKCDKMVEAHHVFDGIKKPDVVSWTALISGYAENGDGVNALELFTRMRSQGCSPNSVTFAAAFKACGLLGALESGSKIHAQIRAHLDTENERNATILVTCLVDFYAKCGCLLEAQKVFDSHPRSRNLRTWTALLAGYSRLGDNQAVFALFQQMQDAGFQPDGVTCLCVLNCCSHAGLVEKANEFFEVMSTNYEIPPTVEHYTCMIDILGRSNKLDDAIALLQSMPCGPNAVTWMTVLGACRKWKNVEIGRMAFKSLLSFDLSDSAAYVLMAHIYKSRGMWEEQEMLLGVKERAKAWKRPEQSCWTHETGKVHTFLVGNRKNPEIKKIQETLMKRNIHIAELLNTTSQHDEKDEDLCGHSEKLALACALVNTQPEKVIRIVKNLRVCEECHNVIAVVSKLEIRTVMCRDASKFHVFKDGRCSCGDFW